MLADRSTRPPEPAELPSPLAPRPYRVGRVLRETSDTMTLTVRPASSAAIARPVPGQFNMLYAVGVGEAAISVSGVLEGQEIAHTVRRAGKVTEALAELTPGDALGVRGPYGHGWPLDLARGNDLVLVAGGLGLPPLRPVLEAVLSDRGAFGRVEVIYGARTPKDLVYYADLQDWRQRSDLRLQTTVDVAGGDWNGDVGVVTRRLPDARFEPDRTVAMLCGPEIMMRLTAQALVERQVPASRIFLSMERNMKCAIGLCGHCQFGPSFVCRDGPVLRFSALEPFLAVKEV